MKGADGIEFNFNRIVRVVVSGRYSYEGVPATQVIEYCPMANENLNARIDATIKCMPLVVNKNGKPGFAAKITIYNPPEELLLLINQHVTWPIGYKTQKDYYATRCRVSFEAGYWNPDKSNPRDYTSLGEWWLNSSAYYRKGVDNVLELYCHELKLSDEDIQDMTTAAIAQRGGYTQAVIARYEEDRMIGDDKITWDMALQTCIRKFAPEKAPLVEKVMASEALAMSIMTTVPTESDRAGKTEFYEIHYIYEPSDYNNPRNGEVLDPDLRNKATIDVGTRGLVANGHTFPEKLQVIADYFPEPIIIKEDLRFTDGRTRYYVWRPRRGDGSYSTAASFSSKEPTLRAKNPADRVVIYNFQNFLQVPSVDGAGCFTAKMLFNPQMRPQRFLCLKWSTEFKQAGLISPYTQGVATTADLANYFPSLQGGLRQQQVATLASGSNGYIFDQDYRIGYVTHTLSTHSNSWYTEVKTTSIMVGG